MTAAAIEVQSLPFSVTLARTEPDLWAAAEVRAQAYERHVPGLGSALGEPDDVDRAPTTAVILCRTKSTGAPVGTVRVQHSAGGPPLLERSVRLPDRLLACPRVEVSRLAAVTGADPAARPALMKALYLYCLATQAHWMVIGARGRVLEGMYRGLGFTDVFPDGEQRPLAHAGGLPHRILALDVLEMMPTWRAETHPLYPFMFRTYHPDLQLFPTVPNGQTAPARDAAWTHPPPDTSERPPKIGIRVQESA